MENIDKSNLDKVYKKIVKQEKSRQKEQEKINKLDKKIDTCIEHRICPNCGGKLIATPIIYKTWSWKKFRTIDNEYWRDVNIHCSQCDYKFLNYPQ